LGEIAKLMCLVTGVFSGHSDRKGKKFELLALIGCYFILLPS